MNFTGFIDIPYNKNKFALFALVNKSPGLGMALACSNSTTKATQKAIFKWATTFGMPKIIKSDQGSHFTARAIKHFAEKCDIQWSYYLLYNPTASGNIERFNGLLKRELFSFRI